MGAAPTRDQGQNLVENVKASGGLPATKLVHPQGSEALIYHHGATVTSFKTANKTEGIFFWNSCTRSIHTSTLHCIQFAPIVIFVSSKAIFDGKKPIRGGIPIIFPKVLKQTNALLFSNAHCPIAGLWYVLSLETDFAATKHYFLMGLRADRSGCSFHQANGSQNWYLYYFINATPFMTGLTHGVV